MKCMPAQGDTACQLPHLTATLLRIPKSRSRSCWWDHSATLFEPSPLCAQRFQASTTHTQLRRVIAPAARGLQVGLRAADGWWPCCSLKRAITFICVCVKRRHVRNIKRHNATCVAPPSPSSVPAGSSGSTGSTGSAGLDPSILGVRDAGQVVAAIVAPDAGAFVGTP